ncbi:MAG: 2-amino-4-hydroxy-6-hydroxymethyldihydropteridine diphosphokinase [gamma proteobacterium symbiont of Taylorina sp.]|nr:2-amino-4-hydroxy-6-hydroxymethyldihydropteridine diphosphokinase [gamma proteobacterium symbiont of Taylorina sp.]
MICYISLGSNLDQPELQLRTALERLKTDEQLELLKVSSLYRSKALILPGSVVQGDYINAVAQLETKLSAKMLLLKLHEIEVAQGRKRKEKWGARTLDLDILLYANEHIQTSRLTIPHKQIKRRNFVIHPLYEIAGAIEIPGIGCLSDLAEKTSWDGLEKKSSEL